MKAKTINSQRVWQSPDGVKTIWEISLEADNQTYQLKTYSEKIASVGFEGDVETYVNNRGDRFVRQIAQKQTANQRDDYAIRAQWAIGQAIALASATMDKKAITLPVIEAYAKDLFATVSRVKGEALTPQMREQADAYINKFAQTAGA